MTPSGLDIARTPRWQYDHFMDSLPDKDSADGDETSEESLNAEAFDPVLEVFKRDIDFTLVERNLRLTTEERSQQLVNATRFIAKFRPLVDGSNDGIERK